MAFSASRRLARDGWDAGESERVYGAGAERSWGSGENYEAHFVFSGAVDTSTGMLVNLSDVKAALAGVVDDRYDHHFLNLDTPPFDALPPTPENLARRLLVEGQRACAGLAASLVACHLAESAHTAATAWADGRVEREYFLEFSAARRTHSPHLSDAENAALFGRAASPAGHGHGYRLRVVLRGAVDDATGLIAPHAVAHGALSRLHELLDHRNLNLEVRELEGAPITTECLARFVHRRLAADLPVARVRLHEMPHFFAEHDGARTSLGLEDTFSAAHCLRRPGLSADENRAIYGKCSNPNGHGHRYTVQATLAGPLDERTGVVFDLARFTAALFGALAPWDRRHLDLETDDFRASPSTGENIVRALWPRLAAGLDEKLVRLRLFETANNRFALRGEA
jgi:6-pyruvoyltetrahydropterin/6-carboxytetrahydropterin synthase